MRCLSSSLLSLCLILCVRRDEEKRSHSTGVTEVVQEFGERMKRGAKDVEKEVQKLERHWIRTLSDWLALSPRRRSTVGLALLLHKHLDSLVSSLPPLPSPSLLSSDDQEDQDDEEDKDDEGNEDNEDDGGEDSDDPDQEDKPRGDFIPSGGGCHSKDNSSLLSSLPPSRESPLFHSFPSPFPLRCRMIRDG